MPHSTLGEVPETVNKGAKILLTGASGLLGSTLVPHLRRAGHAVVTQGHLHAEEVDLAVDITERPAVHAMLDEVRPQIVVNLVALTDVDRCEERPDEAWRLNVRSVETLAGWVGQHRDSRLVQVSTDHVYDGKGPHGEDDIDIVNVYALSKYAGELAALASGATVLRTNFFGPSGHPRRRSFSDWIVGRLGAGEAIVGFEDVRFSPLTMDTLSAAIARVVERPREGVFNLGSRHGCSKAEFARLVARHHGLDEMLVRSGSQADVDLRARRPMDMRMDCRLFEETFDLILPETKQEIAGMKTHHAQA